MNRFSVGKLLRLPVIVPLALLILVVGFFPALAVAHSAARSAGPASHVAVKPLVALPTEKFAGTTIAPPTDAQCRQDYGFPCYSPQEMRTAYDVTPLINAGDTGKGQSIVIIDSYGSPTIQSDLQAFDQGYGLPAPPSFKIVSPLGTVPFDPNNSTMVSWAFETTLDVEWSHAMAPGASIVLMTSPVAETEGVQGLTEFMYLEQYAVQYNLGKIISQSWAATENTLFNSKGRIVLNEFNTFYEQATTQDHVTFFASTGDSGVANAGLNGGTYPFPTVGFPASSPYVTAVGGTSLYADTSGNYQSETVWDEVANSGGATGGGISQYFKEPSYQVANLPSSDQQLLNGYRGIPDVAYNADPYTPVVIYAGFVSGAVGYYFIGGTSEGSPQWAGITADFNQYAGHPLGFLNPAIYAIGNSANYSSSFHDITVGNNSYGGIKGYYATTGWDPATGWGSPQAANLAAQLAAQIPG